MSNSGSKNAIKKKFQSLFKIFPAAARAPRSPTTGVSHLSDIVLAVSASAREEAAELATGAQKFSHAGPVVRHAVFWCIGGATTTGGTAAAGGTVSAPLLGMGGAPVLASAKMAAGFKHSTPSRGRSKGRHTCAACGCTWFGRSRAYCAGGC